MAGAVSNTVLREFIRKVYREGADEAGRITYLDGLSDIALSAQSDGKVLMSTSGHGAFQQYRVFSDWSPASVLFCIDRTRDLMSGVNAVDTVLAKVPSGVRSFRYSHQRKPV